MAARSKSPTERDREALRTLLGGGDFAGGRFDRLQDLGLVGYEARTDLKGTSLRRVERVWITVSGLAEAGLGP